MLLLALALNAHTEETSVSLAGPWRFAMGAPKPGLRQGALPVVTFADTIALPGTTETQRKGPENRERAIERLTRLHRFDGPAWYEREVMIPESWRGREVTLFLERTKYTQVWLDGQPRGVNDLLCTPQEYALGRLEPGRHRLTVVVDNSRRRFNVETHQTSDNTQGNWNGILGRIELRARPAVSLEDVRVFPDVSARTVSIEARIGNTSGLAGKGTLHASIRGPGGARRAGRADVAWDARGGAATLVVALGKDAPLWDEFHPALHRLTLRLEAGRDRDESAVTFGLREFTHRNGQFVVNGRTTFLRGKNDGCVFPLTGHPPMDAAGWRAYFRVCLDYGFNHVRFHTWTPPEAAFAAADELGVYLQPELPFWGAFEAAQREGLMPEAIRILEAYGNHPSFVMFALGNELGGSREVLADVVRQLRRRDGRRLYAQGSNNFLSDPELAEGDDYWTTFRTRVTKGGTMHNVRGSFATVDAGNGHVQVGPPGTMHDYSAGVAGLPVPVIGHEIGQFTVYPNFREIAKYTGVFRARNFEHWRERLNAAGMGEQADDFFRASGRLAVRCNLADIEAALRTPGFGGFQLLDLQDFPGQGTALVGVLDAFMDSKGLVTPEEWRQSCGPVVLLARLPRYTWAANETFRANVELAHYGAPRTGKGTLAWSIADARGRRVAAGKLPPVETPTGGLRRIGEVTASFEGIEKPTRLDFALSFERPTAKHRYPLWVFPPRERPAPPAGVRLVRRLGAVEFESLARGERVVFVPEAAAPVARSVGGGFATDFWCWPMFKNQPGTMGILCDPRHPALAGFPTEFHSDWQWFHVLTNSRPVILDGLGAGVRPIAQVVDNLARVHRLGLIFEAKVGPGRLLVCASDLLSLDTLESRHLLAGLFDYAASGAFEPRTELTPATARDLLAILAPVRGKATASSSQTPAYGPDKAIDGDAATRWCASDRSADQWWQVELASPRSIKGCVLDWEFERAGYRYVLEGSTDGAEWIVLSDQRANATAGRHSLAFDAKVVRHVRLRFTGLPEGAWASLRELRFLEAE